MTLIGFLSFLSKHVSHNTSDLASKYSFNLALYSALQVGHPTEFILTAKSLSPTSLKNCTAKAITSASSDGLSLPNASIPNWWELSLSSCLRSFISKARCYIK